MFFSTGKGQYALLHEAIRSVPFSLITALPLINKAPHEAMSIARRTRASSQGAVSTKSLALASSKKSDDVTSTSKMALVAVEARAIAEDLIPSLQSEYSSDEESIDF
jgi:hypothetical protein